MGLYNSPKIFQEKKSELFFGLDTVRVYNDELLYVTKGSCKEHVTVLEELFSQLQNAGIKFNSIKSYFGAHKFEYLGYQVFKFVGAEVWFSGVELDPSIRELGKNLF